MNIVQSNLIVPTSNGDFEVEFWMDENGINRKWGELPPAVAAEFELHVCENVYLLRKGSDRGKHLDLYLEAEREECAKICERMDEEDGWNAFAGQCAAAIRARSTLASNPPS